MLRFLAPSFFPSEIGIQVFSRDFSFVSCFLFIYPSTREQRRTEFVDQGRKDKKERKEKEMKKKKKEKKKHLNWAPKLPLCSLCFFQLRIFAPVKSHLPRYYVQEQRQLKTKKKEKKNENVKTKRKKESNRMS